MLARNRLVPLIVACALFMEHLDSTILATALPAIARSFGEDPLHLSLAISSYLLSLTVFIPLSGWMADRYGARSVFRNAILIFVIGSLGCALAQGLGDLVAARMLQGLGAAMMVPVARLVLLREVPKSQLVGAMAYVTIPALVAPVLGPPLGGLIVTYVSWRWIFIINLPIGVLGWWLVTRYIRDSREPDQPPLDLAGWMLLGAGVAGIGFGFENLGKQLLPSHLASFVLVAGFVLLALYVRHVRSEPAPIIRLSLLRIPTFRSSIVGGSLFRIGIGAFSLLMPLMLQLGFGMSALRSGMITFAVAIGSMLMKTLAERLSRRYGFRRLLIINAVASSTTLMACGLLRPELPYALLVGFMVLSGFLRSLQFTCINAMSFADIDEDDMSQATSFSATAQQLALSVGVGIGSQVLNLSLALRHGDELAPIDFAAAFIAVGLISMMALLSFRRLPQDAGSNVSGHRLAIAEESGGGESR